VKELVLEGALCRLRPYRAADAEALQAVANDPRVTRWMTARFPYPYTREDAEDWIASVAFHDPPRHFVIEADGAFAGAIGFEPRFGEHRGTALFGYWLGPAFWGRDIATDAARTLAAHALRRQGLRRLEASVFEPNRASARVLEKAGFTLEGRLRASFTDRDGATWDELVYARLASDSVS
jgi:[ribosomal protein S5]-alanine N-acetyltransferase